MGWGMRQIDFVSIRNEYENTKVSYRKLSEKYGVNKSKICRISRKEKWVKYDPKKKLVASPKSEPTTKENNDFNSRYREKQEKYKNIPYEKINKIKTELGGHYTEVDEPLIVMYGDLYQKYLILTELISEEGDLVVSDKGVSYTNPRFNNYLAIIERLSKLGDKLGLSISSRKRMGLVLGETKQLTIFDFLKDIDEKDDNLDGY